MLALDFILSTISHFVRDDSGPSPGVPVHASAGFEHDLMRLCETQGISAIVAHSLRRLTLPPDLSRLAQERLSTSEQHAAAISRRLMRKHRQLTSSLKARGISCLVAGDAAAAGRLYPPEVKRPVFQLELLVSENDWPELISCLNDAGFELNMPAAAGLAPRQAVEFFQVFTPCLLTDQAGDQLRLTFRLFYYGRPVPADPVWASSIEPPDGNGAAQLGFEDQLIRACLEFSLGGLNGLLLLTDIGLLVSRCFHRIDWDYLEAAVKRQGLYNEIYMSLKRVEDLLNLGPEVNPLKSPGRLRENLFELVWGGQRGADFMPPEDAKAQAAFHRLGSRRFRYRAALMQHLLDPPPPLLSIFSSGKSPARDRLEFIWRALRSNWDVPRTARRADREQGELIDRNQGW